MSCADDEIVSSSSPIGSVPLEIIAHIFANLPPASLGTCQLVCKAWHDVVVDEGSWRVRTRVASVFLHRELKSADHRARQCPYRDRLHSRRTTA